MTRVGDIHMHFWSFGNDLDGDAAFAFHGVDRVADQVLDHPTEEGGVQRLSLIHI